MRKWKVFFGIFCGLLLVMWGGFQLSKSRSFQFYGGLITHVDTDSLFVALTLDDGPTPVGTEIALSVLDSLNAVATFFVTGGQLQQHMEWGKRIVDAGHSLGNHSFSHRQMVLHSSSFVEEEIVSTDSLIREAGWAGDIPFRPPYGKRLFVLPRYLNHTNRSTILWDIEPESYAEIAVSAENITQHVVERIQPGSIILLHVMYESRQESRLALPMIIKQLREKGYQFVTLQELLSKGPGTR